MAAASVDPLQLLADALVPVFAEVSGIAVSDAVVRPSDHADAQANAALALAKQVGRPPREIAQQVVDRLAADPAATALATYEVAGPGFVNVTFRAEQLGALVAQAAAHPTLGVTPASRPEKVVVDYSAPNVAKEMHVGHIRSTFIGDVFVRICTLLGHEVVKENHIGDWGTPFGMLIEHQVELGPEVVAKELASGDLTDFYRAARARFDGDADFAARAQERVVMLQAFEPHTIELWQQLVDRSADYFTHVYGTLGVLLTNDDLMGESAYHRLLPEVLDRLADASLLTESDGAEVVFPPGFTNRDGDPLPLIVRKGSGGFNYATSDLACVIDRVERLGATLVLYVVGAPQAQHLEMVFAVARMAGWVPEHVRLVHVAFGNVLGSDRKMFKTRSGDTVKLMDLVDEAIERGTQQVRERNPEWSEAEIVGTGRMLGIGALKYADLSTDRVRDYVFEWDRMLAFDGNTAPYLQYAHARIRSMLRRAAEEGVLPASLSAPTITEPAERTLALKLLAFDGAVHSVIDTWSPHKLCTYLFELAQDFTAFYEACPVLRAASEEQRASRLALSDLTARVLAQGLDLLGITVPERM
jgi:arginyl-tRNA synthetase